MGCCDSKSGTLLVEQTGDPTGQQPADQSLPQLDDESFNIVESSGDKESVNIVESSGGEESFIPEWCLADEQTRESFQIVEWFQRYRATTQDKDALAFAPESWVLTLRGNVVSAAEVLGPAAASGMFMVKFEDGGIQQVQAALMLRTTIAFSGLSGGEMLWHTWHHNPMTVGFRGLPKMMWRQWVAATESKEATVAYGPLDNDLFVWHARIEGPAGTPFENHRFYLDLRIPEDYPSKPPKVRCITPIYHTNVVFVEGQGGIKCDVLGGYWSPAIDLPHLLSIFQVVLSTATGGPSRVMQQFERDPEHYQQLAREWTEKFAEIVGPRAGQTRDVPLSLVYVKNCGRQVPFNVSEGTTVAELKEAIQSKHGTIASLFDLALQGRLLANGAATLFDLGVQHEDTLRVCLIQAVKSAVVNQIERAVEIKYDGKVRPIQGIPCVASFPGKYGAGWDKVVAGGSGDSGHLSVACVFLPKLTPKYGRHAIHRSTGRCFCHEMYGEEKEWGCEWVRAWQENVEEAVRWGQRLQVFYFAGMVGQGKVASWEECGHSNLMSERLWAKQGPFLAGLPEAERARLQSLSSAKRFDSSTERGDEERRLFLESLPEAERAHLLVQEGLGWSQKAEVAWLEKRHRETGRAGYLYEEVDVQSFLDSDSLPRAVSI